MKKYYRKVFKDLLEQRQITTNFVVVQAIVNNCSDRLIYLCKKNDGVYSIHLFDLLNFAPVTEIALGGKDGDYIKCKDIEQSKSGTKFALPYNNDGRFRLKLFKKS